MELHITNGSCAADLIKDALKVSDDQLLTVNDLMCCGPLLPAKSHEDWVAAREAYWNDVLIACNIEPFPMSDFPRDFYFHYAEMNDADSIHIWLGTSLGDQLMLAFVVDKIVKQEVSRQKVMIHQFNQHPERDFQVTGINLLEPQHFSTSNQNTRLTGSLIKMLAEGWKAVTAKKPELLIRFINQYQNISPVFVSALSALISRFPDKQSGLSIWEERILDEISKSGPELGQIIGNILGETFKYNDLVGDLYLFALVKNLSSSALNAPLIKILNDGGKIHNTQVALTEAGKKVLNGKENLVALNGIERYIAGFYLSSQQAQVWYREGEQLVLSMDA